MLCLACLPRLSLLAACALLRSAASQVNNYELEKNYNFAISMFERLVRIQVPRAVLRVQVALRGRWREGVCVLADRTTVVHMRVR